uniref:Uncharacterized protein n=1 Tax=Oryza brachyantha TaxID=4533 RepID=J3NAM9_ORYBR
NGDEAPLRKLFFAEFWDSKPARFNESNSKPICCPVQDRLHCPLTSVMTQPRFCIHHVHVQLEVTPMTMMVMTPFVTMMLMLPFVCMLLFHPILVKERTC